MEVEIYRVKIDYDNNELTIYNSANNILNIFKSKTALIHATIMRIDGDKIFIWRYNNDYILIQFDKIIKEFIIILSEKPRGYLKKLVRKISITNELKFKKGALYKDGKKLHVPNGRDPLPWSNSHYCTIDYDYQSKKKYLNIHNISDTSKIFTEKIIEITKYPISINGHIFTNGELIHDNGDFKIKPCQIYGKGDEIELLPSKKEVDEYSIKLSAILSRYITCVLHLIILEYITKAFI